MKPVKAIVRSRWYLCASVGEPGHQTLEVQSELGSYPTRTAANRVLFEDDPDCGKDVEKLQEKIYNLLKSQVNLRPAYFWFNLFFNKIK